MIKALLILISLALFDSIDPFPTGATVYLFSRPNGEKSARKYLATAMSLYILVGLVIYLLASLHLFGFNEPNSGVQIVLGKLFNYLNTNISYAVQMLIGILLIGVAIWEYLYGRRSATQELKILQENANSGIGKIVMAGAVFYLPSAIPFLISILALVNTDAPLPLALFGIVLYVVLYMVFPITINILHHLYGEKAEPMISRIRQFINKFGSRILSILIFMVGAVLIFNALYFFTNNGQSFLLQFIFHNFSRKL